MFCRFIHIVIFLTLYIALLTENLRFIACIFKHIIAPEVFDCINRCCKKSNYLCE